MRWVGRTEPGSASGSAGHLASMRRPNATVDANDAESCFVRPGIRCGRVVSPESACATRLAAVLVTVSRDVAETLSMRPLAVRDTMESAGLAAGGLAAGVDSRAAPHETNKTTRPLAHVRRTNSHKERSPLIRSLEPRCMLEIVSSPMIADRPAACLRRDEAGMICSCRGPRRRTLRARLPPAHPTP
jgi:hypothetical protein